ncbi:MAG: helix-turn-helix domain-containing protein [Candidatus Berkelbacteria bacterium]
MFVKQLEQLGLNETEAKTYLALLKIGSSSVGTLSKESGIARTTLYYSIEELKKKGFVFEKLIDQKKRLIPRSPEFLGKKAEKLAQQAHETAKSISSLIPALKKLAKEDSSYSTVNHYEGKESVWEVFEIILRSNKDSLWFGFGQSFLENYDFDYFVTNFSKKRRQFGRTKSFNIIPPFKSAAKIATRGETDFQEFRFLGKDQNFNAGICIFGNKIAIFSYDNVLSATLIQGDAIAEIASTMFKMIWKSLS